VGYGYDMPCYSPIIGYRSRTINPTGKRSIVFNRSNGFSDLEVKLPCGQCIGCRIEKSRQWAIRCCHEAQTHESNCFVTLTYSDENLPYGGALDKEHLQKFFKRLRRSLGKFRYFASGEYGDASNRPHYHCLIFGIDFSFDRREHSKNDQGDQYYISETLDEIWGMGNCLISNFSYQTAAYTARYVMKKLGGSMADSYIRANLATGQFVEVPKEFAIMSLKPGIGSKWFDQFSTDVFPSDYLVHQGKKHSVPRYYTDKLKKGDEIAHKAIKGKRKKSMLDDKDSTPDRLYTREVVKKSQISQLKRKL